MREPDSTILTGRLRQLEACAQSDCRSSERKVTPMLQLVQWMQARIPGLRRGAERGAAAVEYGLLVALIAVAIVVAVITLSGRIKCSFSDTSTAIATNGAVASTGC